MNSEHVGENAELICRELESLVNELAPEASIYEESGKTIFFYRKNICYIQNGESEVQFGFFGEDIANAGKQKAVCFFSFTSPEQIDRPFLKKLLGIYINRG